MLFHLTFIGRRDFLQKVCGQERAQKYASSDVKSRKGAFLLFISILLEYAKGFVCDVL